MTDEKRERSACNMGLRILAWGLYWLTIVGWGGTQPRFADPQFDLTQHAETEAIIKITPPDADGTFLFTVCGASGLSPDVRMVSVVPASQKLGSQPIEFTCRWSGGDGASLRDWRYATQASGSNLKGACLPLRVEKRTRSSCLA